MLTFVLNLIVFLAVLGLVLFIFYFRITALQESKKVTNYLSLINQKLGLQEDFSKKSGNDWLPKLSGTYENRDLVIERTIQEKYKYLVISFSFQNPNNFFLQITPKSHLKAKEKPKESQVIQTGIQSIDNEYFVSSNNLESTTKILQDFFEPIQNKYKQIWFLFSTFLVFQNRITFVLLSVPTKLKYDLILEQMVQDLYQLAKTIEQNDKQTS
ncbi:MAG: hypothetical protein MUC49_10450 [Raineya sp.]|jgi:hypothetical protein|nr:hypothetical protein [Raineya sp.]